MLAFEKGHAAIAAVLLDYGADPNTRTQKYSALGLLQLRTASPSASSYLAEAPTSWRSMLTMEVAML